MGKASKFKKFRRLASQLPALNIKPVIGERISGKDLIGIEKDSDGNRVDVTKTYTRKRVIEIPLNHNRKMKKIYEKDGLDGVGDYMTEIRMHAKNLLLQM